MLIIDVNNENVYKKNPEVKGLYPFVYLAGGYDLNSFIADSVTGTWMEHFIRKIPEDIKARNFSVMNPGINGTQNNKVSFGSEFLFLKNASVVVMYIPPGVATGNTEVMLGIVLGRYYQGGGPNKIILGIDRHASNYYSVHGLISEYNKTMNSCWQFPTENNSLFLPRSIDELVNDFCVYMRTYHREDAANVR